MEFKPALSVKETLDYLTTRLDPILAERLDDVLGGHPWTVVLDLLDQQNQKKRSYAIERYDLQAQLRMLSERLGELGWPFGRDSYSVKRLAAELKIFRNQSAHNAPLTTIDAFRSSDYALRLLEQLDDGEGMEAVRTFRRQALEALAAEENISVQQADETPNPIEVDDPDADDGTDGDEGVEPDTEVLSRDGHPDTTIGNRRLEYEPWTVVPVGGSDVIEYPRRKASKAQLRAAVSEIVSFEGPIHIDRLTRLVLASFDIRRKTTRQETRTSGVIKRMCATGSGARSDGHDFWIDGDGFVWPAEIDRETWSEFRPAGDHHRPFHLISPVEIANAARFLRGKNPGMADPELRRRVMRVFGRQRETQPVTDQLSKAWNLL